MKLKIEYVWLKGNSWSFPLRLVLLSAISAIVGYVRYEANDAIVPIISILVVACALYYAAALLINKTFIVVSFYSIEILHDPIPWFGERELSVSNIESIRCERRWNRTVGSHYLLGFALMDGSFARVFPGVLVTYPENALQAMHRIRGWLSPMRTLEITSQ